MADLNKTNPLAVSDEDFLKQNGPEEYIDKAGQSDEEVLDNGPPQDPPTSEGDDQKDSVEDQKSDDKSDDVPPGSQPEGTSEADSKQEEPKDPPASTPDEKSGEKLEDGKTPESAPDTDAPKEDQKSESESGKQETDYKGFYEKIMAPFPANGRTITLKDPAEAIQLMQMGANYTRKLQEIAPHRKILTMLGNHGLLDESKLSLFIALDKGDPEAIKKFVVDKGIDPLDIDTKTESTFQDGSFNVSDEEVAFRTQLDEIGSSESGRLTLQAINGDWDQASKDQLWENPSLMPIIHAQREAGIYAKITEEMDRLKTVGKIPPNTPFLEAYKIVGDELDAQGAFAELSKTKSDQGGAGPGQDNPGQPASAEKPAEPTVLASRPATPRPIVDNGDKAGAASPTRSNPGKPATEVKNPLSMSDEDFIKANNLEGRV